MHHYSYSVWSPYYITSKPTLFIPLEQFVALVNEISAEFPAFQIIIPPDAEDIGLIATFDFDDPDLRPKWLGHSASKRDYEFLESSVSIPIMASQAPPAADFVAFKQLMANAIEATKQNNKASKEKRKQERASKTMDMGRAFKRAQRYLGLRPRTTSDGMFGSHAVHDAHLADNMQMA